MEVVHAKASQPKQLFPPIGAPPTPVDIGACPVAATDVPKPPGKLTLLPKSERHAAPRGSVGRQFVATSGSASSGLIAVGQRPPPPRADAKPRDASPIAPVAPWRVKAPARLVPKPPALPPTEADRTSAAADAAAAASATTGNTPQSVVHVHIETGYDCCLRDGHTGEIIFIYTYI